MATDSCTGRGSSPFLLNLVSLFFINHPWHHCTTVPPWAIDKRRGQKKGGLESPTMDAWWQNMYWECSWKPPSLWSVAIFYPKYFGVLGWSLHWESVVHGWNQILVKKDVKKCQHGVGGWQETEKMFWRLLWRVPYHTKPSLDKWRQAWKTEETSRRRVLTSKNATPQSYDFTGSSVISNHGVLIFMYYSITTL